MALLSVNNGLSSSQKCKYRIIGAVNFSALGAGTQTLEIKRSDNATPLQSTTQENVWIGIDIETVVEASSSIDLVFDVTGTVTSATINLKNFQIIRFEKAEIQDSDMRWAGRRTSYYEGTKITSRGINLDSPDTIDGGPVVTVKSVSSNIITSVPTVVNDARALVNRGTTVNQRTADGRAIINVASTGEANERAGRALVNVYDSSGNPLGVVDARNLVSYGDVGMSSSQRTTQNTDNPIPSIDPARALVNRTSNNPAPITYPVTDARSLVSKGTQGQSRIIGFDAGGNPVYTTDQRSVASYADTGLSSGQRVMVTLYDNNGNPVVVDARALANRTSTGQ